VVYFFFITLIVVSISVSIKIPFLTKIEIISSKFIFDKDKALAFEMDFKSSIDIDTEEDFMFAEILGKQKP
jgi:CMP-N-acetylneuraminic acid synthetase